MGWETVAPVVPDITILSWLLLHLGLLTRVFSYSKHFINDHTQIGLAWSDLTKSVCIGLLQLTLAGFCLACCLLHTYLNLPLEASQN